MELSRKDQQALAEKTFKLGSSQPAHKKAFNCFHDFLKQHHKLDVLIDGANVGFCNQSFDGGEFKICQVETMTRHFVEQQKRVLV